jgi:hypothetical protein
MSRIVDFRQNIIDSLKTNVKELEDVDWFDGQFDEQDIKDWSLNTPCAFVGVLTPTNTEHHTTMELNAELRVIVAVIVQDTTSPRDADEKLWEILEKIVVLANLNAFGFENASPSTTLRFERLRDPELRREGVALGIVQWTTGVMIGRNRVYERDFIWYRGEMITQVPPNMAAHLGLTVPTDSEIDANLDHVVTDTVTSNPEVLNLTPPDEAFAGDEDE